MKIAANTAASALNTSEPISIPNHPARNAGDSASFAIPHSRITAGATPPVACTSKPSITRYAAHGATIRQ
ncbi:4-hydroxybenzoate transporter domain protein [Burkholderia mallei]|nr:4-hydroxybenzoate transporter domain protein [Burkholderia mallei]